MLASGSRCFLNAAPSALVLLLLISSVGCRRSAEAEKPEPTIRVKAAVPVTKRIVEWDDYTARLEPVESVEVRARVGGYLQSIHFVEGQIVKRDDLLCVIDRRPFEADVKRAQADLAEARAREVESTSRLAQVEAQKREADARLVLSRRRMQRARTLIASNTITRDEYQVQESELLQTEAAVEAALSLIATARATIGVSAAAVATSQAALEIAQLNLEYTQVRAPVSGRVSRRLVTEGNLVSGGSTQASLLTTIVSLDPIHCYFDADEAAYLKYLRLSEQGRRRSSRDVKNPVYIALADEKPGFPHKGHMDFVDNRMDLNTGTIRGRAILRNPDLSLTPGLFARLRLPGSGPYNAILLPDRAVLSDQSEKFVYTVAEDGTVNRQVVAVGPIVHGLRVVRRGLKGSEKVIIEGLQRVRPEVKAIVTLEKIEVHDLEGLPDTYEPVPKKDWISREAPSESEQGTAAGSAGDRRPSERRPAVTAGNN